MCEMLWPGVVLSFNIYVLFFFFVNQRLNLRQTFFFFFSVCVMADGECRCVLFCLKENQLVFFFCWLILLSLFNLIHLQELYKS